MSRQIDPEAMPYVTNDDDGIRPAGPPDACLYCQRKVGERHKVECVSVVRPVVVTFQVAVDLDVAMNWDANDIKGFYNNSWCGSNLPYVLLDMDERQDGCLCRRVRAVRVGEKKEETDDAETDSPCADVARGGE